VNADYALVAEDLVKLGFVPPDLVDPEKTASVVPQLSRVFGELMQGGGARKVNFQQVFSFIIINSKRKLFSIHFQGNDLCGYC
jgi:aarF domain-containing kinase